VHAATATTTRAAAAVTRLLFVHELIASNHSA